jgi:predicted Rossmann-fold nucleotide-binding protein
MLEEGYISEDELDLFKLVDSSQEAAELIMQHINRAACEPESESEPDPETSA